MSWRSVLVSKAGCLSLYRNCLVVKQEQEVSVPLEDISVIVIENTSCSITARLLAELAEQNIPVIICDHMHLPSGIFLSYAQHSRFLKVLKMQLEQSQPFRKNCWKLIVVQKIRNQALCLEALGKRGSEELRVFAQQVKSGDTDNRESAAARVYFDSYMPDTSRQEDNNVNAALNYGYSIMRGAVARSLTSYGFLCAVGVHHKSELNQFNLADDFMEVLRPVVDLWVARNIKNGEPFTPNDRAALISLLGEDILIDYARQAIMRAIDIMCASFVTATTESDPSKLKIPELQAAIN